MTRIAIVVGTTRPGRKAETVARWVHQLAAARGDAEFEVLDLESFGLPLLDEPLPPSMGQYSQPHTHAWSAAVAGFDGFVFVTPEYNHGMPGSLKNAIDFLNSEWANKAAGFVGYGVTGGSRSVEQLRLVLAELRVATVRAGGITPPASYARALAEDTVDRSSAQRPPPLAGCGGCAPSGAGAVGGAFGVPSAHQLDRLGLEHLEDAPLGGPGAGRQVARAGVADSDPIGPAPVHRDGHRPAGEADGGGGMLLGYTPLSAKLMEQGSTAEGKT